MGDKLNPAPKEGGGIVSIETPDVVCVSLTARQL